MTDAHEAGSLWRRLATLPPPLATLVALGAMILLSRTGPGPLLTPWPWTIAGMALMGLGLILGAAATLTFMRAGATPRLFHGGSRLVEAGPFRLTRNPMYLSLVITLVGTALVMGHLTPWLGPVALALWLDRMFVPREEAVLAAHFGADWDAYRRRVRRWI
ncbi:methyltransferase family protein [Roseospira visakhapatnamensis]|uniref:Protein-S-isoprenylcysteine O-methyltransferase Ste14 n=1 Tax=Roseospira visakhapatnamensis TaxID=390880 RepID=A0A7W6WAD0_9PROT|nr:isoprenylcysteine carboxylmethyltransferase family protein [Roseospira visakhapatnamensis]MBB4266854.1 protein-S-isoprenylcysteine O-methyltransferase Ste14 [Roseospira visakhapatnamensis]